MFVESYLLRWLPEGSVNSHYSNTSLTLFESVFSLTQSGRQANNSQQWFWIKLFCAAGRAQQAFLSVKTHYPLTDFLLKLDMHWTCAPALMRFLKTGYPPKWEMSPRLEFSTYQTLIHHTCKDTAHTGTAVNWSESSQQNFPLQAPWFPLKECHLSTGCLALNIPGSASGAGRWNDLCLGRVEVLQGLGVFFND